MPKSPFQRAIEEGLLRRLTATAAERAGYGQGTCPADTEAIERARRIRELRPRGRPPGEHVLMWVEPFLEAVARGMGMTHACDHVGIDSSSATGLRKRNAEFRRRWNEAADIGTRLLEQEAQRRAYHGTEDPILDRHGNRIGTRSHYSDGLMMFLLKGRRPEKYRDHYDGGPRTPTTLNVQIVTVDAGTEQPALVAHQSVADPLSPSYQPPGRVVGINSAVTEPTSPGEADGR